MLYLNIQQLHQRKFKVSQIAQELKVSRPTVYKYLKMTFEETKAYMEQLQGKGK
ncbi:helix-turn-helix domain-containing protein, partial [Bacillus subtilis]